ncbi:MAG: hypothetical protein OEZ36_11255 [Spirochaetota bacterium]|nr:hypothetical protein [Spirochaetota bacterium]
MDHNSHLRKDKVDYYRNLFNQDQSEQNGIIEAIADKLLDSMDVKVFDFSENPRQSALIHQIRSKNKVLRFKKPLSVEMEKSNNIFLISQKDFAIEAKGESFQMTLREFQDELYQSYQRHVRSDNLSAEGMQRKKLYLEYVENEL